MESELNKILLLTKTNFEIELAKSTFKNLDDKSNKLRFNNFSVSLRELSRHILKRFSPDENVLDCKWYKNEIKDSANGITRGQRIKYAIQGGLSDVYLKNVLKFDYSNKKKKFVDCIDQLSKFTHIEEKTFDLDESEIIRKVKEITLIFEELFTSINECQEELIFQLDKELYSIISNQSVDGTIEKIDNLSTHYSINSLNINQVKILLINSNYIIFKVLGELDVIQQFGSSSDLKNDIGLESLASFPFESTLRTPILILPKIKIEKLKFQVFTDDDNDDEFSESDELTDEDIDNLIEEHLKTLPD